MELVVDANILFSALIKDSHIRHYLLFSGHSFYVPEFIFEEVYKHLSLIEKKSGLSSKEIRSIFDDIIMIAGIKIIPFADFQAFADKAKEICPDPNDVHYFALALKLKCSIWSNDKKLRTQDIVTVYTTEELVKSNLLH